jgi:hypothetical protein
MMMQPLTLVGEFFVLLQLFLGTSFDLSLFFCNKRSSSLSSARAQLLIMLFLARDVGDVFSAAMPTPKPSAQLGGFSLKKKSSK